MKALTYVEIDVDYCSLAYGVAPCGAALGVTGTRKCFNTLATCQDRAHFTNSPVTLRFAMDTGYLPEDIQAIPSITAVSFTPATISLGEDMGQRASLSVTFEDHRYGDTGVGFDKYVNERPYDPFKQGTFWGKFRARQPYLRGRPMRLIRGLVGQTLAEMETHHFILENFQGPSSKGSYTLIAKDLLKLADGDRAQAPQLSNGFLASDLEIGETTATLSPAGIGNLEYPSSGYVAIGGKEICAFSRSGNTLSLSRGLFGTDDQQHDPQDRVQVCLYYEGVDPANIIADLLQNYAEVPSTAIPLGAWFTETQTYLRRIYTAMIAEPTPVKTLVSELIEQGGLAMWWDLESRLIRLQVLRAINTSVEDFNDTNLLKGSLTSTEQPDKRISQIWTYFGKINPLESASDPNNYRSAALSVNLQAQTDYGTPAIKKIYSRWIPAFGRLIALRLNSIQLGRFQTPPRRFQFSLMKYVTPAKLGSGHEIEAWHLQDDQGALETVPIQITRVNPKADKLEVEAEEVRFVDLDPIDEDDRTIVIDGDVYNVNLRTIYNTLYPAPVSGDIVKVFIEDTVKVYSKRSDTPAFNVGPWPSGVIIQITMRNSNIRGKGGDGGRGSELGSLSAGGGESGGTALYTRYPISLTFVGANTVWGGGGGGGGSSVNTFNFYDDAGGGGGGGAGVIPGRAGIGPAPAEGGTYGSEYSGGGGGRAFTTENWWDFNYHDPRIRGGSGGSPGAAGGGGQGWGGSSGGPGGNGGYAIDGIGYVSITGAADRRGPEV